MNISNKEADKVLCYLLKKAGCKTKCYVSGMLIVDRCAICAYDIKKKRIVPIKTEARKNNRQKSKEIIVQMFDHSSHGNPIFIQKPTAFRDTTILLKPFSYYENIVVEADLDYVI